MPRRPTAALILALLALLLAPGAAGAAGLVIFPANLEVKGKISITTKRDFTGNCEPGQAWTIDARAEVDVAGRTEVEVIGNDLVRTAGAVDRKGAVSSNRLTEFRETNYCDEPVELDPPPVCKRLVGTGIANLQVASKRRPVRVSVGISRRGGGEQDLSCIGNDVIRPQPTGSLIETLQSPYESIVLPLDLTVKQLARMKPGNVIVRRTKVSGACVGGTRATSSVFREDVCSVSGNLRVEIKRLQGKGRGVSIARPNFF